MAHLVKDEKVVEQNGEVITVTRTIVEEYTGEEYVRTLLSLDTNIARAQEQLDDMKKLKEDFTKGDIEEKAEALRKSEREKIQAERDAATKKSE
jgi:hypothetical protein